MIPKILLDESFATLCMPHVTCAAIATFSLSFLIVTVARHYYFPARYYYRSSPKIGFIATSKGVMNSARG